MNSMDGIENTPKIPTDRAAVSPRSADLKELSKSAEEYVAIANRLAAQREQPKPSPQLDSIFDQLRGRLPK
jgi:hypothetical protein